MADNQTAQAQYELPEGTGNNPQEDYNDNFRTADHAGGWVTAEIASGQGGVEGEWYTFDNTGKAKKAQADAIANCVIVFILTEDTAAGLQGRFLKAGNWVKTSWGGDPSKTYYLSQSVAGAWTTTEPLTGIKITLGRFDQDTETFHIAEGGGSGGGGAGTDHALLSNLELALSGHTLTQTWQLVVPTGGLLPCFQLYSAGLDSVNGVTGYDISITKTAGASSTTDDFIGHRTYWDYADAVNSWGYAIGSWHDMRAHNDMGNSTLSLIGEYNKLQAFAGAQLNGTMRGVENYIIVDDLAELFNSPVEGFSNYIFANGQGVGGSGAQVRGLFQQIQAAATGSWQQIYGTYNTITNNGAVAGSITSDYHYLSDGGTGNVTGSVFGDYYNFQFTGTYTNLYGAYYASSSNGASGTRYGIWVQGLWDYAIYIADNLTSYFTGSVTAGQGTAGTNSEAFGLGATAVGNNSTVIGNGSSAAAQDNTVIGYNSSASADISNVIIGTNITYSRRQGILIGNGNSGTGNRTIAIGFSTACQGDNAIAIGAQADANGAGSIAIGKDAQATGGAYSIALGYAATTSKDHQLKIGSAGYEIDWLEFVTTSGYVLVENTGFGIYENSCIGGVPNASTRLQVLASSIDTTDTFKALAISASKTAGATDASDYFIGSQITAALNQAGGTLGYVYGDYVTASVSNGTTTDLIGVNIIVQNSSTTNGVSGDMIGSKTFVRNLGPSAAMTGDAFALWSEMDIDGTFSGTAYMHYYKENSNIDWCIYQDGTAPSRFGGPVTFDGGIIITGTTSFLTIDVGSVAGSVNAVADISETGDIAIAGQSYYGLYERIYHTGTGGDTSSVIYGGYIGCLYNQSIETLESQKGLRIETTQYNGSLTSTLEGLHVSVYSNGVVNSGGSHSYGIRTSISQGASGQFTYNYYGIWSGGSFNDPSKVGTAYQYFADGNISQGWNYGFYSNGDVPNYFSGTISAGQGTAGLESEAFGSGASAVADYSTVFGHGAYATPATTESLMTVIGRNAYSTGRKGTVFGAGAYTTGNDSVVIGGGASNTFGNSVVIGDSISNRNNGNVCIGANATPSTYGYSICIGYTATLAGSYSVAISRLAVSGTSSIAIGYEANATFEESIAIGRTATTTQTNEMVIGATTYEIDYLKFVVSGTYLTFNNNVQFIGNVSARPTGTGTLSEAFGGGASAIGNNTTVLGSSATDNGNSNDTIIGHGAYDTVSVGGNNVIIGVDAYATAEESVVIGQGATVDNDSVVIGCLATGNGEPDTIVIGRAASAYNGSVAIGRNVNADGDRSIAIGGRYTQANFDESIALGYGATTTQTNEMVVGAATYEVDNLTFIVSGTYLTFNNTVYFTGDIGIEKGKALFFDASGVHDAKILANAGLPHILEFYGGASGNKIFELTTDLGILGDKATFYHDLEIQQGVIAQILGTLEFGQGAGTGHIKWHKYTANSVTLNNGTSSNVVADLQTANDGNVYAINEAATTPGIQLIVDFTSVTAFQWVDIRCEYDGSTSHNIDIELYNWNSTSWDKFNNVNSGFSNSGTSFVNFSFFLGELYTNYVGTGGSAGQVRVRFNHPVSGNAAHDFYIDVVALYQ